MKKKNVIILAAAAALICLIVVIIICAVSCGGRGYFDYTSKNTSVGTHNSSTATTESSAPSDGDLSSQSPAQSDSDAAPESSGADNSGSTIENSVPDESTPSDSKPDDTQDTDSSAAQSTPAPDASDSSDGTDKPAATDSSDSQSTPAATSGADSADTQDTAVTTDKPAPADTSDSTESKPPIDKPPVSTTETDAEVTDKPQEIQTTPPKPVPPEKPDPPIRPVDPDRDLSEDASEYEGIKGTGKYNYGEALQKSFIFYELQRSGKLSGDERTNWRGDSGMSDGADNGVDLTGGLYDAGDNVKFNLPMAYTGAMLAWSVYEDYDSYKESGQLEYALSTIRWINDYLIKCHTAENEFYYQVGDGSLDHAWWGPPEVMQMKRPSYKVTESSPGSTVVAEAAASLAACAAVFSDIDKSYADTCLTHAKQLYDFAYRTKSDAGYTAANGYYNSWSGFYDELAWAGTWLYTANGGSDYLDKAKSAYSSIGLNYKWAMCWDDVSVGAAFRLGEITGDSSYNKFVENNLDYWTTGVNGERITYTPKGLAWLDTWGSLRYATTQAFIAACYSEKSCCPQSKRDVYWNFAVDQVNYALGDGGRSYVCGFGENYPVNPHHRNAQGSYCDNMNEPKQARHTLYGALVGGPDQSDGYSDDVSNYTCNEVACDYNAGYTCALAKLYGTYKGQTLVKFGAVEPVEQEYTLDACVNAKGESFTEIKAIVYNKTAWCARVSDNLTLRYFMDLSETSPDAVSVNMGYAMGGAKAVIKEWNKARNIYCVEVSFTDNPYPGGQDAYRREVQFRISSSGKWDDSNDFSYSGLGSQQGTATSVSTIAVYDGGVLVCGSEPDGSAGSPVSTVKPDDTTKPQDTDTPAQTTTSTSTTQQSTKPAQSGEITLTLTSDGASSGNTMAINIQIQNNSDKSIDLGSLEIDYFFTRDGSGELMFTCDHSAVQGDGVYEPVSTVAAKFEKAGGSNADTVMKLTCGGGTLGAGEVWIIQARVNKDNWSDMDFSNDFSHAGAEYIAVYSDGKLICGSKP